VYIIIIIIIIIIRGRKVVFIRCTSNIGKIIVTRFVLSFRLFVMSTLHLYVYQVYNIGNIVKPFNRVRTYNMKEKCFKQIADSTHDLVSLCLTRVRTGLICVLI
jgi:hypothetical protein